MTIAEWLAANAHLPFAYLTTSGRVSGQPHRIEIWFAVDGDRVLLMSGGRDNSDWVKNLISNPEVSFELGDEIRAGQAMIVQAESVDDALARQALVAKYQKADELADWRVRSLPVVISFGVAANESN